MKGKGWRSLILALVVIGVLLLPSGVSTAFAGGPMDTYGCGHIGNDSFCLAGEATWNGSRVNYSWSATPYLVGPGNFSYYDRTCGWYYSSNHSTVDNVPNSVVFWCNYTVYPYNTYLYPRAWVDSNGQVGNA